MSLVERIKKERTYQKEVSGITYTLEIPKLSFIAQNLETNLTGFDLLKLQIKDWKNANEAHFVEDGDEKVDVEFDGEILEEFLSDHPEVVKELYADLIDKSMKRSEKLSQLGKHSKTTSKKQK